MSPARRPWPSCPGGCPGDCPRGCRHLPQHLPPSSGACSAAPALRSLAETLQALPLAASQRALRGTASRRLGGRGRGSEGEPRAPHPRSRSSSSFPCRREGEYLCSWEVALVWFACGHLPADTQVQQTDKQTQKDTPSPIHTDLGTNEEPRRQPVRQRHTEKTYLRNKQGHRQTN